MSAYIKLSTLEYPRHEGDIRLEHPEILESQTGDTFPCPSTYAKVEPTNLPVFDHYKQRVDPGQPELVDGIWRMTWIIRNAFPVELEQQERERAMYDSFAGEAPNVIG